MNDDTLTAEEESAIAALSNTVEDDDTPVSELYRRVAIPAQAQMRRGALAAEKQLKKQYVDYLFDKLNLSKYK